MFTEKQLNRIAMLGSLSLFLSTVEYLFPRPIPLCVWGWPTCLLSWRWTLLPRIKGDPHVLPMASYFLLILLKVLGQGMVNGTMASYIFLFSLSGSLASGIIMFLAWHYLTPHISFIGISVLGALVSNMAQITLSITFIFGMSAWRILPLFLGIGLVSGLFIGLFAQRFSEKSLWWAQMRESL